MIIGSCGENGQLGCGLRYRCREGLYIINTDSTLYYRTRDFKVKEIYKSLKLKHYIIKIEGDLSLI